MKYILNKYVFFILVFIATFLFDFIIFQLLFPLIVNNDAGNITLGMIVMISSFIVVPSAVAYYFAIKRYQGKLTEQEKIRVYRNRKITIGFILAIILVLIIHSSTSRQFNPYKFQPITEQEFTKPLKILVNKKIAENDYYLKESGQGGVSLYQKVSSNREDDKFILDLALNSQAVSDFWYDNSSNTAFGIESRGNGNSNRMYAPVLELIFKFTPDKQGLTLGTSLLGTYSTNDKILDYFFETDTLVLENGLKIWSISGKEEQTILQLQDIQFLGYDGKFLYLVLFDSTKELDLPIESVKEIYKIDLKTKNKITLADGNFPDNIIGISLAKDQKSILIQTIKNRNSILNLEGKPEIKEASSSANN